MKGKIYTLNLKKWRCGGIKKDPTKLYDGISLGLGETSLKNSQGFQCCLGQFAEQKLRSLKIKANPYGELNPSGLASRIGVNFDPNFVFSVESSYGNTTLSCDLVEINDNTRISVDQKLNLMRKVMQDNGLQLRVINKKYLEELKENFNEQQ